ncbi:hypothetical protein FDG2_2947 [Candidatus Protofrankia californiensis]|uniref:Uncharacterized protein n=1 Tax=Candidatus Protofrankia californiensis TaxID=1839754 RepID=A0A1C3NYN5_9ACTN|nr:hypothetical protein FDG2_2947 [Candidatus Protofrankia californiensis]
MRIRSFNLDRYGAFEGRDLEFGPALTLVVGANEAGKSTTLEALSDLLWGYRRGHQDFTFAVGTLSLTARLDLSDGSEVEIRRRNTGLATSPDGHPFEPVWGQGGPGAHKRWRDAFGLSHAGLREGGDSVFHGTGDLAELVFTARSGRAVRTLVSNLQAEMDGLYKQHRGSTKAQVRAALINYDRLSREADSSMTRAKTVADARDERTRRQRAADASAARLASAIARHTHADQWRRALPDIHRLAGLRAERARLLADGLVLRPEQIDAYETNQRELDAATGEVEQLTAALATQVHERESLTVDDAILADSAAITRLERQAGARSSDAGLARQGEIEAESLFGEARTQLLGLVGPGDQRSAEELLTALYVPVDLAAQLDELATRIGELTADLAWADDAVTAALARQRASASAVPALDAASIRLMREVIMVIRAEGSASLRLRESVDSAAAAYQDRREALRRAGARDADGPPPAALTKDAVRLARERLTDAETAQAHSGNELTTAEQDLERARQRLATTDGQNLPDPAMLVRIRAERSDLWDRLVRAAADGLTRSRAEELLPSLASAVRRADEIADQLISQARFAAKRAQQQRDLADAETRHRAARNARSTADDAMDQARQGWGAFWNDLGLATPVVDEADEVRRALDEAQQAQTALLAAERRIVGLTGQADAQHATLAEALAQLGHSYPGADLDSLLVAADQILADDDAAREARNSAALHARSTEDAQHARGEKAGALLMAEQRWDTLIHDAALPSTISSAGWAERHAVLTQAVATHDNGIQARKDAVNARARVDAFTEAVAALAVRHGDGGFDEDSPAEVLHRLVDQVRTNRDAQASAKVMDSAIAGLTEQIEAAQARRAEAANRLDKLRDEVGLPADQPFHPVVERSRAVIVATAEERITENVIRAAAPDDELETLVKELAERDERDLQQELATAREDRDQYSTAHDQARSELGEIDERLRQLQRGPGASELHAQAQEYLALVAEGAERYLIARFQHHILRGQLEAYERRHASPLLVEAGRLLERLTEGSYVALRAVDRGDNQRFLRAVRADEEEREPVELSEGTADQVFLALRLAAIDQLQRDRVARGEVPLPVVLDDVLMTFDDRRAAAALRVLTELARNWQIIVFTHHEHLAEIAESVGSASPAAVGPDSGGSVRISRMPSANVPLGTREADRIRASVTAAADGEDDAGALGRATVPTVALGRPPREPGRAATASTYDPAAVRTWARAHGYDVGDRGRIASDILDAFQHAQGV